VLSDGDNHRLVGGRRQDGAHAVGSSGETSSNRDDDITVSIRTTVDTLEEHECLGVGEGGRGQRADRLNDDVGVPDDLALGVEGLGVRKVGLSRGSECPELGALDPEGDVEGGVLNEGVSVRGVLELGRGHVAARRDVANGRRVARATRDLETVRDGGVRKPDRAEVDEVVGGHGGGGLPGCGGTSSRVLDDRGVKGRGRLEVTPGCGGGTTSSGGVTSGSSGTGSGRSVGSSGTSSSTSSSGTSSSNSGVTLAGGCALASSSALSGTLATETSALSENTLRDGEGRDLGHQGEDHKESGEGARELHDV
jgi:hypothetical protein